MSLKDELIRKAETQLEEWEKQADSLKAKAKAKEAEAENEKASADIQQSASDALRSVENKISDGRKSHWGSRWWSW